MKEIVVELAGLIASVYEAADPAVGWQPLLRELSCSLRTPVLAMVTRPGAPGGSGEVHAVGSGRVCQALLPRLTADADSRGTSPAVEPLRVGSTLAPEPGTCENDGAPFQPGQPLAWFRLGLTAPGAPPEGTLAGWRPAVAGDYSGPEALILRTLGPHLTRALRVALRVSESERALDAAASALDRLPLGVMLVRDQGGVVRANLAAREILLEGDGLRVEGGQLGTTDPEDSTLLRRKIAEVARARGRSAPGRAYLTVARACERRPYEVAIVPVGGLEGGGRPTGGTVALYVSDPEARTRVDPDALRLVHGLTPTEARVAATLADGDSPEEAADRLRMRLSTLRFHLKHVFAKTGTNRQADLVGMVLRGPAAVRRL